MDGTLPFYGVGKFHETITFTEFAGGFSDDFGACNRRVFHAEMVS